MAGHLVSAVDTHRPIGALVAGLADLDVDDLTVADVAAVVAAVAADSCGAGVDASVTLCGSRGLVTAAATSATARDLDDVQCTVGDGPCIRTAGPAEEARWDVAWGGPPALSARASHVGVVRAWSIGLPGAGTPTGSLNLYSRSCTEPSSEAVEAVRAVAEVGGVLLRSAAALMSARLTAEHLQLALEHRDVIGQAKGILMAHHDVGADEAFDLLRRSSQRSGRKLRDVAADIVERQRRPPGLD